mmetsp:Transcript_143622/g.459504  ORF Transcript_143622/g.459504 Transcript_143622/m.459504 type:complete len:228 (+) Transcript_143622:2217-2900(+)
MQGSVQVPTLHARVEHATVSHSVGFQILLAHLVPCLKDLLDATGSPIRLHDRPIRDSRASDAILPHSKESGLKPLHVVHAAEDVEQGVDEDLVHILRLHHQEGLHERHAAGPRGAAAALRAVRDALRQYRDRVLVGSHPPLLHLLQHIPCLLEVRRASPCCRVHQEIHRSLIWRNAQTRHLLADNEACLVERSPREEASEQRVKGGCADESSLVALLHITEHVQGLW